MDCCANTGSLNTTILSHIVTHYLYFNPSAREWKLNNMLVPIKRVVLLWMDISSKTIPSHNKHFHMTIVIL